MIKPFAHRFGQFTKQLNSLVLASGLVGLGLVAPAVHANEMQAANSDSSAPAANRSQRSSEPATLANGIYLYGESQAPEQIGSAYMVFEVNNAQVVGAFYLPHSSFDCFRGSFQDDRLALTVVDSYNQMAHDYSIAVQSDGYIASSDSVAVPVQLNGYHNISEVSENDRRMLETCQADFQ